MATKIGIIGDGNASGADFNLDGATKVAALAKQHLHRKLIEPEQVANVVAFLFTDGASAIQGSTIPVEDGFQIFKDS